MDSLLLTLSDFETNVLHFAEELLDFCQEFSIFFCLIKHFLIIFDHKLRHFGLHNFKRLNLLLKSIAFLSCIHFASKGVIMAVAVLVVVVVMVLDLVLIDFAFLDIPEMLLVT